MLITISRQYGAGGSEVARRVADALGWRMVDNELVEQVAVRAGLSTAQVAAREERCSSFVERLARSLAAGTPDVFPPPDTAGGIVELPEAELVKITETVVAEIAAQGRVVLVGRAASAVLAREADVLHVKLVAPRDFRLRMAAERLGCALAHATAVLDDTDTMRAKYHRQHYKRDWNDPLNYHMVLNTGLLGLDGAAEVVAGRARRMGWGTDAARQSASDQPNEIPPFP
jgi:cytidylate kinase